MKSRTALYPKVVPLLLEVHEENEPKRVGADTLDWSSVVAPPKASISQIKAEIFPNLSDADG